jgi:hypothetical protein
VSRATAPVAALRFPALHAPAFRLYWVTSTVAMLVLNPPRTLQATPRSTGWRGIVEGLRFVRQHRAILGLTLLAAIPGGLLGFGYQALMPALSEELGTGQWGFGLLLSAS